MPTFAVYTNLPKDNIPADFLQQTTVFLAEQLGKQEQVGCHFNLGFNCSNNECRSVLSLLSISIIPFVLNSIKLYKYKLWNKIGLQLAPFWSIIWNGNCQILWSYFDIRLESQQKLFGIMCIFRCILDFFFHIFVILCNR